jgi:hypothetical protein
MPWEGITLGLVNALQIALLVILQREQKRVKDELKSVNGKLH